MVMNELTIRYTEERYCTRKEVSEDLCVSMIDPIWKEINQYRNYYRYTAKGIKKVSFCLCAGILKKIVYIQTLLYRRQQIISVSDLVQELFLKDEQEKITWLILHWKNANQSIAEKFEEIYLLFPGVNKRQIMDYFMDERLPVFCRWVALMMLVENRNIALVFCVALCAEEMYEIIIQVKDLLLNIHYEEDGTYALQSILDELIHHQIQVHDSINSSFNFDQLVFQYPQLKEYQIHFYVNHHTIGHYYTLNQFSQWCDVCYETARCAMEQLVELNFYTRHKIGKKFVYTPKG